MEKNIKRKELFKAGLKKVVFFAASSLEKKVGEITGENKFFLRPPGAIPEADFIVKCTKCGKCEGACPNNAIRVADIESGLLSAGFPFMEIEKRPCVLCTNMPCIQICPEQALIPIRHDEVFLGKVEIIQDSCHAWNAEDCSFCKQGCQVPGALVFKKGKPYINPLHCVGCGICLFACSTYPGAIKFIPIKKSFPSFRLRSKPLKVNSKFK